MNSDVNAIISELYDMIQDAKGALLQVDKCVIERDAALNLLDEVITQLPEELAGAKKIVAARNELIAQGRREAEDMMAKANEESAATIAKAKQTAEAILAKARETAEEMITKEAVYAEAQRKSKEMIEQATEKIEELKDVSHAYMAESLMQTEAAINKSLDDLRATREKFESMTKPKAVAQPVVETKPFFHDIDVD